MYQTISRSGIQFVYRASQSVNHSVIRPVSVSANVSTNLLQGQIEDGSWEGGTPLRNGVTDC